MKTEARQIAIYNLIKANKEMTVAALTEYFDVSSMTIRRDLDDLEQAKLIQRAYGKAFITDSEISESSFEHRAAQNLGSKQKIAHLALSFLESVQSFYVDGSSSAYEFIKLLPSNRSFTVFTNSVASLNLLMKMSWVNTFVIGGLLCKDKNTLDDDSSVLVANRIFVDATFTSCSAFSAKGTLNNGITGTHIRQALMKNSYHNYILADHTKYNARGIFLLNPWEKIDALITDEAPEREFAEELQKVNTKIVW